MIEMLRILENVTMGLRGQAWDIGCQAKVSGLHYSQVSSIKKLAIL